MFHPKRPFTKGRFDSLRFASEVFGPYRVVLYESDRAFKGLEFTHGDLPELFLGHWWRGFVTFCQFYATTIS